MHQQSPNTLEPMEPTDDAAAGQLAGSPTQPAHVYPWNSSSRSPVDVLLSANGDSSRGRKLWLVAGAAVAVFGLGWAGGANWQRLADMATVSDPPARKVTYSQRIPDAGTRPARADGAVRKPASVTMSPAAPAAAVASSRAAPVVPANITTGSIAPRETLVAVPETRPMTIEGWSVREVRGATAILEGPDGVWTVARGDTVPAVGRIDSIVRWGNRWIVSTDNGLIATP